MARTAIATKPSGPTAAERRAELLRLHEQHRRQRGAALLDGKTFDGAAIALVEQELAGIDDAEAEASRRQAAADAQARAIRVAAVRERVASVDVARMASLAAAEQAAVQMVKALVEQRRLSAEIVAELHALGPGVPDALLPRRVDQRVSEFLIGALFLVRSDQYSFGSLEWHRPATGTLTGWADLERAATAHDLAAILNKDTSR